MTTHLPDLDAQDRHALASRLHQVCLAFPDHRLPLGCRPPRSRIGLEAEPGGTGVQLHVQRGLAYDGADPAVAAWIASGTSRFESLEQALDWLAAVTTNDHAHPAQPDRPPLPPLPPLRPAHQVTDLTQVTAPPDEAVVVDADALLRGLRADVVGQEAAVTTLSRCVARHTAKTRPGRPLTLLLLGPTGVGKTLAATRTAALLRDLTGEPWPFIRLDMAEYSEAHSVARLHGAPPGYIGYRDGRSLAELLAGTARSIILFDEIDKAHPAVFRAVMNLMDAGRLVRTDGARDIDATRCILLFTSNAAADTTSRDLDGLGPDPDQLRVDEICRRTLRQAGVAPELLGRIAHVCAFTELDHAALAEVTTLTLQRVAAAYGVTLHWIDPSVISSLLIRLRDNRLGVRALEYLVDSTLGDVLAHARAGVDHDLLGGTPPRLVPTAESPNGAAGASCGPDPDHGTERS